LREPIGSLKRADVVMLTRCDLVNAETLVEIRSRVKSVKDVPIVESTHRPADWRNAARETRPLEAWSGRPIAGLCAIGNPDAFRQTLTALGLNIIDWRTYPDHHPYSKEDIESLRTWARQLPADAVVVTTQKDLVKIQLDRIGGRELWALAIQLQITSGQEAFEAMLRKSVLPV
jgi:tetraacyldisaccharide 4'-kinase